MDAEIYELKTDLQYMVDSLKIEESQLNLIQLAALVPCVLAPIHKKSIGTNTDRSSWKVSDNLARRTGKVQYPSEYPNNVETKQ